MHSHLHTPLTRRLLLAALASAAGLFALPGCASEAYERRNAASLASLVVVDRDSGQVVPTYVQRGRQFVAIGERPEITASQENIFANNALGKLIVSAGRALQGNMIVGLIAD